MHKLFLIFGVGLVGLFAAEGAQTNLVKNPGFEQPAPVSARPADGWWLYQNIGDTKATTDTTTKRIGNASIKLQSAEPAKCVLVSAPFPVTGGDDLSFSVWARAGKTGDHAVQAGVAFRDADNKVFKRSYFAAAAPGGSWSLISGAATAPEGAVSAEVHLGYTNSPLPVWYDEASVIITNPVSFALTDSAKPWTGPQEIEVIAINRETNRFEGSISATVARRPQTLPVVLEPESTKRIKIPITMSGTGAHAYKINLLDSKGGTMRVLEGKFQTRSPLLMYPPCPAYHVIGEGDGSTRVDALVNVNPAERTGMRFLVEVSDRDGKEVQTASAEVSQTDAVGVSVRVPVRSAKVYTVIAHLVDRSGREVAKARSEIGVCDAKESRVTISPDGFLLVAGKPSFPIGLYSSGHAEEMGRAGFTGTHSYGITTGDAGDAINPTDARLLELLNGSWSNGMRMMVELPRKAIEKAQWEQIRRRVETFRHHPGLLCWGSEERVARGDAPLTNIAALYRLVHEMDTNHPFVLGDTRDVIQKLQVDRRNFFPDDCMDIGIWWWYPIPLKEPDANGLSGGQKVTGVLEPPSWLTTTTSKKPLWLAFQAYQKPNKDARFPTPAEYRCQAYLSIINGAKGIWFYTGSGQKDFFGKPSGLLNKPELSHWDYVQTLVRELREMSPVVMAPAASANISMMPPDAPVQFVTRELNGKTSLIAANRSERAQTVKFTGDALKGKKVKLLYEVDAAKIERDSLTGDFAPFGVHIYQME